MPTESETDALRLLIRQAAERLETIRMNLISGYSGQRPISLAVQDVIDDLLPHTKPAVAEAGEDAAGAENERDEAEHNF